MSMESLTSLYIRNIIDKVNTGAIRIPSFQRGFVWEPEAVAFLWTAYIKNIRLVRYCFGGQKRGFIVRDNLVDLFCRIQ